VDAASHDDAAVYRLSDDRALVATVDFFTPIVDDARTWGAIAAANALSDIYAMGGTPLFALNLVGWPRGTLPFDLLGEVIAGAADVAQRAGCLIVGGHSVDDAEPKFGMAAIGEVHPDRLLTNRGARPGDVLVLTKPLGTGVLTTALKRDLVGPAELAPAITSMITLNDTAARVALAHGARAATDITGFGLLGHLGNLLAGSGVGADLAVEAFPVLPGVIELVQQGVVPGGTRRNLAAATDVHWDADITEEEQLLCADAQTSGGLLMAFPPEQVASALAALDEVGTIAKAVVGRCTAEVGIVRVRRTL
jgi:selenide,water dikinase